MVEVTVSPPRSRTGQVSASSPHRRVVSSRRTCHTNWGTFHWFERCGARTTASALAAAKSSAVSCPPVSGVPPGAAIWSSTRFRRTTIVESAGTTSWVSSQVSGSAAGSTHSMTAFATRS